MVMTKQSIFSRLPAFASALAAVVGCAALTGCVTSTVDQVRHQASTIGAGESVVLLGRRQNNGYETEQNFVSCVGDKLARQNMDVIPEPEFVDTLFPWFEPRVAPINASGLNEMLSQPLIARRLQADGVRYLIWIDGSTTTTDQSGAMTCSVTAGGAGCFGFLSWERDSSYEATIWDVNDGSRVGRISSDANGTSYMPAVVVPVPLIARVQGSACSGLAEQLRTFLSDEVVAPTGQG